MRNIGLVLVVAMFTIIFIASCDSSTENSNNPGPGPEPKPDITNKFSMVNAFPNLNFDRALDIQNSGDGTNRLFVVEEKGVIKVIDNISVNNLNEAQLNELDATSSIFLDIQNRVFFDESELGLLGLAFHPDYANNGLFYVNYTAINPLRSVISQFSVNSGNPNIANPNSEVVILEISQPHAFHNGGQLIFGPHDGYLYISMGDGGPPSGANGTSQDFTNLLGTISRIDVDNPQGQLNYGIPADNPFANNNSGLREEIYAGGLRNPWRLSFDPVTGYLWTGDVGESDLEEIDIIEKDKNYGWPIMEGTQCFDPPSGCNISGLELPIWEYGHNVGRSIIGGFVYRGSEFPELVGKYIYADFVSGRVWALEYDGLSVTDNSQILRFADSDSFVITSFGIDEQNELYITGFDGNTYRLERKEDL